MGLNNTPIPIVDQLLYCIIYIYTYIYMDMCFWSTCCLRLSIYIYRDTYTVYRVGRSTVDRFWRPHRRCRWGGGGLWGGRLAITDGRGGLSDGFNRGLRGRQISQLPWRWLTAKAWLRALRGTATYDDLPGLQQQQKHGCQREKAAKQWHGPDASVKGRKEAMRAEWGQVFRIVAARSLFLPVNGSLPTSTKSFWDSMWSPWP